MNNTVIVKYDSKAKRLTFSAPFHLVDVLRGFPSRRFDPKSKVWKMPLVKSNIQHLDSIRGRYGFRIDPDAEDAINSYVKVIAPPTKISFPADYRFEHSRSGYRPMGHQSNMLNLSWGLPASAWFAKMGTGKTYAAIHLISARYLYGFIDTAVIICPATLHATWEREFKKYATVPYEFFSHNTKSSAWADFVNHKPKDKLQVLAVSVEGLGISAMIYDSVCWYYSTNRQIMTVCDESSRIKTPDAKRTERAIQLGAASKYRLILNGTPIALSIQDLWAQYEFLDPNIIGMGDYWAFKTKYIVMGGYEGRQIVGVQNVEELMQSVQLYTIEVGKEVLDLPPKVMVEHAIIPTPEQKRYLRQILRGVGDGKTRIKVDNTLEKMLRCRQVVGGWLPRAVTMQRDARGVPEEYTETVLEPLAENPKMDALVSLINDNKSSSKFVIWSTFTHEIDAIYARLSDMYGADSVRRYYGGTDIADRATIEDQYCNDPNMLFFIGNPAAAGLGLTLISGKNDIMIYYSGTNAYIDRAQSEDRSHRIGQKNSVTIIDLVAAGTIDSVIVESIKNKIDIEKYVFERLRSGQELDAVLCGD